ncbi:MAG TPA: ABC transporter ATP-binding protein [Candidatus Onthomonas avicola]|nr:ABC transporter ATP-binding protein [Candidatus Onthomonas avicola]
MPAALEVRDLTKHYAGFTLDGVSFCVPRGTIVGLIGENGAGKSTTLRSILGLIQKDGGSVTLLGQEEGERDPVLREQIGVVFDGSHFPDSLTPRQLGRVFARIYATWEGAYYLDLLGQLGLPMEKKISAFSRGMKMKLAIAAALAHRPRLLVLDEATSGLDPVVRDDILDLLLGFVQDEENAILISSHITSDLEKVADTIVFLHEGRCIFSKPKDELIYRYGILRCGAAQFEALDRADVVAWRRRDYQFEALVADRDTARRKYPKTVVDAATIDDIMLLYAKGEIV